MWRSGQKTYIEIIVIIVDFDIIADQESVQC